MSLPASHASVPRADPASHKGTPRRARWQERRRPIWCWGRAGLSGPGTAPADRRGLSRRHSSGPGELEGPQLGRYQRMAAPCTEGSVRPVPGAFKDYPPSPRKLHKPRSQRLQMATNKRFHYYVYCLLIHTCLVWGLSTQDFQSSLASSSALQRPKPQASPKSGRALSL